MQLRKPIIKPPSLPPHSVPPSPTPNHKLILNFKFLLLSMAALLFSALLSLLLFFTLSAASRHHLYPNPRNGHGAADGGATSGIIAETCKASRDPSTCQASLSRSSYILPSASVLQVIQSAIRVSNDNLITGRGMVQAILDASASNQNRSAAANTCLEVLRYADHRMALSADAVRLGKLKDARAWMSAALAYQYDCWSALKYVNDTSLVDKTMSFFYTSFMPSTSAALAMVFNYDIFGDKTEPWSPPKTERDGFWESSGAASSSTTVGGIPPGLKSDVTVCKSSCDYKSVQEAVNAAQDNAESGRRFVIWIKTGVYDEIVRVPLEKRNVVFLGDGIGKTVITGSLNVGQGGVSTYNSATVGVVGDGFMATGITFQNTAGPDAHQAVAFRSDSDLSIIENCEFLGNQDTLYAHTLRQYYKSCRIQGNVDFIFGNSATIFQDCVILVAPRQLRPEKGENNAVTAHGRIDPGQSTGFVFQNCIINGTDAYMSFYYSKPAVHLNFLGRPWKEYSRTVFIRCTLEALISPRGWMPWSGDFALKTLYYGEFGNTGAGSDASRRVSWNSQISPDHVNTYSVQNFIQGDQWISTSS